MGKSMPGKGGSFVDIIYRMKARGPYLGNQIGKCLRHIRTETDQPRNDIQLCLLDSATYAASQAGRDLVKDFRADRAQKACLRWWEVLGTHEWINPPFDVLVDWESGVVARENLGEFGCLEDLEGCLYERDSVHGFTRLQRLAKRVFDPFDPLRDIADAEETLKAEPETVRKALINARLGQGAYRDDLVRLWGRCGVTGCKTRQLLRASHIKPWRISDNRERLDKYNGLLLTPALDLLFDTGLISFADSGNILFAPRLHHTDAQLLGVNEAMRLCYVYEQNQPYLAEHRTLHGFTSSR